WMAGRFGARRVFLGAMMLVIAGSMLCGLANGLPQLLAARVLQGMGGAMMTPVGRAIMVGSGDRKALVRAMAWCTLAALLAPLIGAHVAGLLIEVANWRWTFFITLPVRLLGIVAALRFVPSIDPEPRRAFDPSGFMLCAGSVLAVMALVETGVLS